MIFTRPRLIRSAVILTFLLTACEKPNSKKSVRIDHVTAKPTMFATSRTALVATKAEPDNKALPVDRNYGNDAEKPFDFNAVPETRSPVPAFPYVTTPPKLLPGFLSIRAVPMDRIWLILGDHLHAVEGRVTTRTFDNSSAEMSELEIRRNYENAMRAMGAVKVNTVLPDNPILGPAEGDEFVMRTRRLSMPHFRMTYDVYLARKGENRHWLVVIVGGSDTRLIAIEEQPFKQTVPYASENGKVEVVKTSGAPPTAPQPVDIDSLSVSTIAMPPFPYLAYPPGILKGLQDTEHANFDAAQIIVDKKLRLVEGKVETLTFANSDANMSEMALRRNYEAAVKGLGGIKVNAIEPHELAMAANESVRLASLRKSMRFPGESMSYDSYLVRTPEKQIWLVLMFNESKTKLLVVEEKAMLQSVGLVNADTIRKQLTTNGRAVLHINFDTDKATLRVDGKPAIAEITKLMKADPQLRLAIEGHTDDSGNAANNQALSGQRAETVVQILVKDGIDATRLRAIGYGATQPLAGNNDEAGRAKNRRVELIKL